MSIRKQYFNDIQAIHGNSMLQRIAGGKSVLEWRNLLEEKGFLEELAYVA